LNGYAWLLIKNILKTSEKQTSNTDKTTYTEIRKRCGFLIFWILSDKNKNEKAINISNYNYNKKNKKYRIKE